MMESRLVLDTMNTESHQSSMQTGQLVYNKQIVLLVTQMLKPLPPNPGGSYFPAQFLQVDEIPAQSRERFRDVNSDPLPSAV